MHQPSAIDILLVEDNPGDALLAIEAMKESKLNNDLHHVIDGIEAMEYLRKQGKYANAKKPDLIILDLNLPRMDGREVLKAVKQDDDLKVIPVVVLTTSEDEQDVLKSYKMHANCYVTKPIDFTSFASIVQRISSFWMQIVKLPEA